MDLKENLNNHQSYIIEKPLQDNAKNCRSVLMYGILKINIIFLRFSSGNLLQVQ